MSVWDTFEGQVLAGRGIHVQYVKDLNWLQHPHTFEVMP